MKFKTVLTALAVVFSCAHSIDGARADTATQLPPAKQCFAANAGINGMLGTLGPITGGSSYVNGSYGGVALTGGAGSGATANITVSGGIVTGVAVLNPGTQYVVGDVLSASAASIGGSGSGFSVPVLSTSINSSVAGGSVGYFVPGTLTTKQTWQDAGETILNSQPVGLDQNGCAIVYGSGTYRQVVKDSLGNTIWDLPTTSPGTGGGGGSSPSLTGDGAYVGATMWWGSPIAPQGYMFAYGQAISRTTYPEAFNALTTQLNITCVVGSPVLTGIADTTQFPEGGFVEASCLTPGTIILTKTASTLTLSTNATATAVVPSRIFYYGNGDQATTFNLPNFNDRVAVGRGNMGGTSAGLITKALYFNNPDALGAPGGSATATLTLPNLPSTPLTFTGTNQLVATTTVANNVVVANAVSTINFQPGGTPAIIAGTSATSGPQGSQGTFTPNGTISGGASTPFNIVQPSITYNVVIKVTPDPTAASGTGVLQLGGMQGNISCGSGLICAGNTISAAPLVFPTANPSALVGLTAVNGTMNAAMRSDGAPALDQSISPTMTGSWTLTQPTTIGNGTIGSLALNGGSGSSNGSVIALSGQGVTHLIGTESRVIGAGTSAALDIYLASANPINFFTNNLTRMTVGADGTVALPYALNISGNPALVVSITTNPSFGSDSITSQQINAVAQNTTLPETGIQTLMTSNVGSGSPDTAFKIAGFFSATGSAGTGSIYGLNSVAVLNSGVGAVDALSIEGDINVDNMPYSDAVGPPTSPVAGPFYAAIGGTQRVTAMYMANVTAPANRGMVFWSGLGLGFRLNTIEDWMAAQSSYVGGGVYSDSVINMQPSSGAYTSAIKIPNGKTLTWRNAANSADIAAVYLNGSNQVALGASTVISGDLTYTGSSWTPYTPTASCLSGSATWGTLTNVGKYKIQGKSVSVILAVPQSSVGSCSGAASITLPFTPAGAATLSGRETNVTGKMINGYAAGSNVMTVLNYDNTIPGGTAAQLVLSGTYEIP